MSRATPTASSALSSSAAPRWRANPETLFAALVPERRLCSPQCDRNRSWGAMGRISTVALLEPEQRARVDNLLRRFGYGRIDQALAELASAGIALSRSALHRYAQRLREDDRVPVFGKGPVVVMVIDQRTDE